MNGFSEFVNNNPWFSTALIIWTIVWKGLALWRSAKNDQKYWFIGLLVINTLGLAEIVYLFFICPQKLDLRQLFSEASLLFGKTEERKKSR